MISRCAKQRAQSLLLQTLQQRSFSSNSLFRCTGFIDGKWEPTSNKQFKVRDPATNKVIGKVSEMNANDGERAVLAAHSRQVSPEWKATTGEQRAEWLERIAQLHYDNLEELAVLLTKESGKPLAEAEGEIKYGASYFKMYAELARNMPFHEELASPQQSPIIQVTRDPVGVCSLIVPWNFPNAMLARKLSAALAAGCTSVTKPASETPFSTLALARICEEAGVPAGAVNVVVTDENTAKVGEVLSSDPKIRKVSFTGSTRVGKILTKNASGTMKKVSMELGGNAPFIVFDDADISKAVDGLMASKFRNAGQTCVSANRVLVQEAVYEKFVEVLWERVQSLKVGHGLTNGVTLGPLISKQAVERVSTLLNDAVLKGAHVMQMDVSSPNVDQTLVPSIDGNFVLPAIISNAVPGMIAYDDEIFAPVVTLTKFDSEEEAIQKANDTTAGLASYVFSDCEAKLVRVSDALEYGMVGCNTGMISSAWAPFGGVKESGVGREGSKFGLEDYTEIKYTCKQVDN